MTKDNGGYRATNIALVADDGIGVGALLALARKLADFTDGYTLGTLTDDNDEVVNFVGHHSSPLVVTIETNPKIIQVMS